MVLKDSHRALGGETAFRSQCGIGRRAAAIHLRSLRNLEHKDTRDSQLQPCGACCRMKAQSEARYRSISGYLQKVVSAR